MANTSSGKPAGPSPAATTAPEAEGSVEQKPEKTEGDLAGLLEGAAAGMRQLMMAAAPGRARLGSCSGASCASTSTRWPRAARCCCAQRGKAAEQAKERQRRGRGGSEGAGGKAALAGRS